MLEVISGYARKPIMMKVVMAMAMAMVMMVVESGY